MKYTLPAVALLLLGPRAAVAQLDSARCTYAACALRLSPAWSGLDVVRGMQGPRVASLGFFWVTDVTHPFQTSDSALAYARRAVRVRRVAAALTDAGAVLTTLATLRALHDRRTSRTVGAFAIPGVAMLLASVPLQFRADAHLSSAVWWYNSTF